jgi:hypothetical protein
MDRQDIIQLKKWQFDVNTPTHASLTPSGQKVVVGVRGYETSEGLATQITLPNGKYAYAGVNSDLECAAAQKGLPREVVKYFGACNFENINERATDQNYMPIQINGVSIARFIEKIATPDEVREFF